MYFVIKNNKNVYITLNKNGQPNPCTENDKGEFDKVKAQNILNSLPKTMKRMGFKVECVPDVVIQTPIQQIVSQESKAIDGNKKFHPSNKNYQPSENVTRWVEKFGMCSDVISESEQRYIELKKLLHSSDERLMDILHDIELDDPHDMYAAWKLYTEIRKNRNDRRQLKDEMIIIGGVLEQVNSNVVSRKRTQKIVDGLFDRKYTYRVAEVDEDGNL